MKEKRLLITDVDNTLLDSSHRVSPENLAALRAYTAAGGLFTLATGRPPMALNMLPQVLELMNAPAVLLNGGAVWDPATGETLREWFLPEGVEETLAGALERWPQASPYAVSGNDGIFVFQDRLSPEMVELIRRERREGQEVLTDARAPHPPGYRVLIAGQPETLAEIERWVLAREGDRVRTVYSEPQFLEILPQGVSKGGALRELCGLLDLPLSHVVAVGDGYNDLEMVEAAGTGVAVSNAVPELLALADRVVCSNDEHAMRACVEQFLS